MNKTVVGLVGAISGLASLDTVQAATIVTPNMTGLTGARSFAELLDPIPNALAVLREVEAAEAARAEQESTVDPNVTLAQYHDHHHRARDHHHHHHRVRHHHHHHHHRVRHHHHHHHHHHNDK